MNENFIEYQFSFAPKEPWNEILIAYWATISYAFLVLLGFIFPF